MAKNDKRLMKEKMTILRQMREEKIKAKKLHLLPKSNTVRYAMLKKKLDNLDQK